jgi:hypothetical protein
MGSSPSRYDFGELAEIHVKPITIPIPDTIAGPVMRWYMNEESGDGVILQEFKSFINNVSQVNGVITWGSYHGYELCRTMFQHVLPTAPFQSFTHHQIPFIRIDDMSSVDSAKKVIRSGADYKMMAGVAFDGHMNGAILDYQHRAHTLTIYVFEPHFPISHIDHRTWRLKKLFSDLHTHVDVVFVGGDMALQGFIGNCVQWSIIMTLFYVLNNFPKHPTPLFNTLRRFRRIVMMMWLFSIHRDERTPGLYEHFTNKESRDSDIDVYHCDKRTKSECNAPCTYINRSRQCLNTSLFEEIR